MKPAAFKFLALLVLALCAPHVRAQLQSSFHDDPIPSIPTSDTKRPASIEGVRLGFSGIIPADAWAPIRIYLSGNPLINSGAFGGTVTLEFTQDASQSAQIVTPIATTPGRVLPVEIIAALPRGAQDLRITLRDDSGQFIHERTYARRGPGGESFPGRIVDSTNLVLLLTENSASVPDFARFLPAPDELLAFGTTPLDEQSKLPPAFDGLFRVMATPLDLPLSDFGFDGLFTVIARSDQLTRLPRAKSDALTRWVRSGGCLVVLLTPGPQTWPSLFSDPLPFEIRDPETFAPGASLRSVFALNPSALLPSISGRAIQLAPNAASQGWRSNWQSEKSSSTPTPAGLLAEGPAGLGWLVVLGASPDYFSTTPAGSRAAWFDALKHALAERDHRPFRNQTQQWRSRGSGQDQSARTAIRVVLNSLSEVPPLGDGAFIIVALAMLLLAIALGPFDALFLGARKSRTISWATALGWIALASAIAAFVPPLIRSGDSISRRLRIVDVLQSPQNPPLSWQTALTTFFSNSTNSVGLVRDTDPPSDPRGWFRGISPVRIDDYNDSRPLSGFTTTQFEVRDAGQIDAAGFRMNQPSLSMPIPMGQWTFRTIMDQQSEIAPEIMKAPTVSLDRANQHWTVRIANAQGRFASGALRIGSAWFNLQPAANTDPAPAANSSLPAASNFEFVARLSQSPLADWTSRLSSHEPEKENSVFVAFNPGVATELPGARDRSRSIEALIASGSWACIYLYETNTPDTLLVRARAGKGEAFRARESTIWRILVPLDSFDHESPLPLPSALPSVSKNSPAGPNP